MRFSLLKFSKIDDLFLPSYMMSKNDIQMKLKMMYRYSRYLIIGKTKMQNKEECSWFRCMSATFQQARATHFVRINLFPIDYLLEESADTLHTRKYGPVLASCKVAWFLEHFKRHRHLSKYDTCITLSLQSCIVHP